MGLFSYVNKLGFVVLILYLCSCSSTKYVADDNYLLSKVQIINRAKDISKPEIKSFIRQKENLKIFGVWKFHLSLYNMSGRDTSKWINRSLRHMGEEPVIYDDYLKEYSKQQIGLMLQNKGYYLNVIKDTVIYKKKQAKVIYVVYPGIRYRIGQVKFQIEDDSIRPIIEADSLHTLLKPGRPYDIDLHDKERERITADLRDKGYFAFSKEYIYFIADSANANYSINDTLVVKKNIEINPSLESTETAYHKKYRYRKVFYSVGSSSGVGTSTSGVAAHRDTLEFHDCTFIYNNRVEIHPSVILNSSYIAPNEFFNSSLVAKTQTLLNGLKVFRYIDVRFKEVNDSIQSEYGWLDCYVQLNPTKYQSYGADIEGTNASGNLGAAGSVNYQHRNLLRGAEVFNVAFRTAMERQLINPKSDAGAIQKNQFNSLELGAESSLEIPKFLVPYNIESFRKKYNPNTNISISYNYQRRPDYTRTIANLSYGYHWRSSKYITHYLILSDLNLIRLPSIDQAFKDTISKTFLKNSYEDHFILNSAYSWIFNSQLRTQQSEYAYGRFNVEFAGNVLNSLVPLFENKNSDGFYEILGIRYAQYVKGDFELRYHHALNRVNSFAYRFFLGAAFPYGNSLEVPFEKQYFSGGANGIRAWPVRGLGPGVFVDSKFNFYNQTADMKLELNAEYRFKLIGLLEGALFVDAGNIWNIRKESSQEGGLFAWNSFAQQIAVGVGTGLRFDFNYFLFRVDLGIKAHDPVKANGERWVIGHQPLTLNNMAFNFAIGYPF